MPNTKQPMVNEEIDYILERFDQTDPQLQREIVARFMRDAVVAKRFLRLLVETIDENYEAAPHFDADMMKEIREFIA